MPSDLERRLADHCNYLRGLAEGPQYFGVDGSDQKRVRRIEADIREVLAEVSGLRKIATDEGHATCDQCGSVRMENSPTRDDGIVCKACGAGRHGRFRARGERVKP